MSSFEGFLMVAFMGVYGVLALWLLGDAVWQVNRWRRRKQGNPSTKPPEGLQGATLKTLKRMDIEVKEN